LPRRDYVFWGDWASICPVQLQPCQMGDVEKSCPLVNSKEFDHEVALLKQGFQANFNCDPKRATPQIVMHWIIDSNLRNIFVAARIFLAIPPTVAAGERGFSTLKFIKNTLRSTMSQDRLNSLGILSINADVAMALSFDDLIDEFASQKVRKGLIARRPWTIQTNCVAT